MHYDKARNNSIFLKKPYLNPFAIARYDDFNAKTLGILSEKDERFFVLYITRIKPGNRKVTLFLWRFYSLSYGKGGAI